MLRALVSRVHPERVPGFGPAAAAADRPGETWEGPLARPLPCRCTPVEHSQPHVISIRSLAVAVALRKLNFYKVYTSLTF